MEQGRSYCVYVYLDIASRRIVASSKLDKFFLKTPVEFQAGRAVDLLIWRRTELGYSAIIDNARLGILYENEVFQDLQPGQRVKGFIKKVREDQKIDLSLRPPGYQGIPDVSDTILDALRKNGGFLAVSDAAKPETIQSLFGISKKTFKKAVGALYKKRLITLEEGGLRLRETKASARQKTNRHSVPGGKIR
jgi:predicted RNA-binding protein (virulence factor B family)